MDVEQVVESDRAAGSTEFDCRLHRCDIGEHLDRNRSAASPPWRRRTSASSSRRGPASNPSILDEATDSARSKNRANPSRLTCEVAEALRADRDDSSYYLVAGSTVGGPSSRGAQRPAVCGRPSPASYPILYVRRTHWRR